MDTEISAFTSSNMTSVSCHLKEDIVLPEVSYPSVGVTDDASSSSSDNHASSDCDVMNCVPDEKTQGNDEEYVPVLATSDGPHQQIPDQNPVQFPEQISEQISEEIHHPTHASNLPALHDIESDAIVRVQQKENCQKGSEKKDTIIPVADLANNLPTLAQGRVKAVPVSHHFYNQWARVPRTDEAEGDVSTSTRKPISMRMFTATGSLKSYTLMNAIVRDKRSPIQNFADLFQTNYTSSASAQEGTSDRNNSGLERSLSDTVLTRNGFTKTDENASQESQKFPPIADLRAKTAPDTGKGVGIPKEFVSVSSQTKDLSTASYSSFGSDHLFGSDVKKRPFSQMNPRKLLCSSSFCRSHSTPILRPLQALSINTASLLFTSTVDMRDQHYHQLVQRHPRGLFIKATQNLDTKEGNKNKPLKDGGSEIVQNRAREVKRIEFIDFSEVKSNIQAGDRRCVKKKSIDTSAKSASASRRACFEVGSRDAVSADRLNVRQFLTVGMTLPIHACLD